MAKVVPMGMKVSFDVDMTSFKDAAGNPTTVDPNKPVTALRPSVAGAGHFEDADGNTLTDGAVSSFFRMDVATGPAVQLQADIDVDRGSGVKTLTLVSEDLQPAGGEAVVGSVSVGEPQP